MRILAILLVMLVLSPAQAEVYRWVDESGNVHFADTPPADQEDLEPIDLPPLPTVKVKPIAPPTPEDVEAVPTPPAYEKFFIAQPDDQTSVRANNGDISIVLGIVPGLRAEDTVFLYMDNQLVAQGGQTAFPLANVNRGTHKVRAEIRDDGQVLIATAPVTFTLHRHSIQNP